MSSCSGESGSFTSLARCEFASSYCPLTPDGTIHLDLIQIFVHFSPLVAAQIGGLIVVKVVVVVEPSVIVAWPARSRSEQGFRMTCEGRSVGILVFEGLSSRQDRGFALNHARATEQTGAYEYEYEPCSERVGDLEEGRINFKLI